MRISEDKAMPLKMTINGELTDVSYIDPDTPLLWALRDHRGLGAKYGGDKQPRKVL